ncbi:hypothetical protein [Telmatospirillum sp.]|uniref:hypothetical protein n=1 Tax=Telmatospirillum sp. TaxID=2079197 RepID=UPI00284AC17F|nr:hypothetical protein [Telmatospirillum sp.]MDR3436413.1 hypothetical protein [Telmatospirillum sp.]
MHDHEDFESATSPTSSDWAHKASPLRDRKAVENLDFLAENGLELDLGEYVALWRKRKPAAGSAGVIIGPFLGDGQAAASLHVLSELVETFHPHVGGDFLETARAVVMREGGIWKEFDTYRFSDGSEVGLTKDGAYPEGGKAVMVISAEARTRLKAHFQSH